MVIVRSAAMETLLAGLRPAILAALRMTDVGVRKHSAKTRWKDAGKMPALPVLGREIVRAWGAAVLRSYNCRLELLQG
jgi:hypothetical protein